MTVAAIFGVIVLGLLAAVLRLAGRVLADEGRDRAARRCALLAAGFAALAVLGAASVALGHDIYRDWRQPGTGVSCCSNHDCRPTRAYMGDDGLCFPE